MWKAQSADLKQISAVLCQYVDDLRNVAASEKNCLEVMHKTATLLCYLGIQGAARKIRPPSQIPGAWAGTAVTTTAKGMGVKCTSEKWKKAKGIIDEILMMVTKGEPLNQKDLECKRGFLIHVA